MCFIRFLSNLLPYSCSLFRVGFYTEHKRVSLFKLSANYETYSSLYYKVQYIYSFSRLLLWWPSFEWCVTCIIVHWWMARYQYTEKICEAHIVWRSILMCNRENTCKAPNYVRSQPSNSDGGHNGFTLQFQPDCGGWFTCVKYSNWPKLESVRGSNGTTLAIGSLKVRQRLIKLLLLLTSLLNINRCFRSQD